MRIKAETSSRLHAVAKIVLVIVGIFSWELTMAQSPQFSHETLVDSGDTLRYRQLLSDYHDNAKYPLVIFLHGRGERGEDNEAQLKWGVRGFTTQRIMSTYKPIIIAPQCPDTTSWGGLTYDTPPSRGPLTTPMRLLLALIEHTIETLPVDSDRIYITGLSMGGFGTFDALTRRPDLFAAAVPVCGGGDISLAPSIAHIPMWIYHGALDSVVSPELSIEMHEALRRAGASPGLTIYPDTGHFAWIGAYADALMMDWLFSQKKEK